MSNIGNFLDNFVSAYSHAQLIKEKRADREWERSMAQEQLKFRLEEAKFDAQMKMKQFEFTKQRELQSAKMEEQRNKEQHFNNLLDATTQLLSTRQTAVGYGEDTSALDTLIGNLSEMGGFKNPLGGTKKEAVTPQDLQQRTGPLPRTAEEAEQWLQERNALNMPIGQAAEPMQQGIRTRGRSSARQPSELEQQAKDIKARVEIETGKQALSELGVPAEDLEPNYKFAESANSVWRANDNAVKLTVGKGGEIDFGKRHLSGVTPFDADIIEKDPNLITEANVGLLQATRSTGQRPSAGVLARYKDQVIASAVEAFHKLNPDGKVLTTSDVLSEPKAAKALQIAHAIDGSRATYEHLTGEQLNVQGLPSASSFVAEGPDVLVDSYLTKYRELQPQGVRAQGRGSELPGVLPENVELTRRGEPARLAEMSSRFAAALMSEDEEWSPHVKQKLGDLANEIAQNPAIPGQVIRAFVPVFERAGVGIPGAGQPGTGGAKGTKIAPPPFGTEKVEPKERPVKPLKEMPGTTPTAQAGPARAGAPGALGMAIRGGAMLSMGAAENVTKANAEFTKVKNSKDRAQAAKDAVTTIKTEHARMTAEEKKAFKGTWAAIKGTWKGWKIPQATIDEVDKIING